MKTTYDEEESLTYGKDQLQYENALYQIKIKMKIYTQLIMFNVKNKNPH